MTPGRCEVGNMATSYSPGLVGFPTCLGASPNDTGETPEGAPEIGARTIGVFFYPNEFDAEENVDGSSQADLLRHYENGSNVCWNVKMVQMFAEISIFFVGGGGGG